MKIVLLNTCFHIFSQIDLTYIYSFIYIASMMKLAENYLYDSCPFVQWIMSYTSYIIILFTRYEQYTHISPNNIWNHIK